MIRGGRSGREGRRTRDDHLERGRTKMHWASKAFCRIGCIGSLHFICQHYSCEAQQDCFGGFVYVSC